MVWVQLVHILYTKASRGAPTAAARNGLPRAFPMHVTGRPAFCFESYRLLERRAFVPELAEREQSHVTPTSRENLVIDASDDALKLGLRGGGSIGQPARRRHPAALILSKGQTAKLIINGRYTTGSGSQYYIEETYNVAFDDPLSPDVFVETKENAVLDLRSDLF